MIQTLTIDPTPFILISWLASALLLGGLAVHALLAARRRTDEESRQ